MIPLASDLVTVFRQRVGGEAFVVLQSPNQLFSFGRTSIVGASSRKCPEVIIVHADKIAERCKEATEIAVATGRIFAGHVHEHWPSFLAVLTLITGSNLVAPSLPSLRPL